MKKLRLWLATIAVLLCSVSVKAQWGDIFGYDFGVDGVYYNITSDFTVEVTNSLWARYSGIIEIPSNVTYNNINYSVTGIGEDTFNGCINLTSVTIPNSVTSIGKKAFFECSLASITIPNTVKHIGEEAFEGSTWWNNQPNGVVYLQKCLVGHKGEEFANGEIKIKDGTMTIANCALKSCYTLTKVTIPGSLEYIGEYAFDFCENLKTIINFSNINISKGSSSNGRIAVYADLVINADDQLGDFFFLTTLKGNHYLVGYLGNENDLMLPENYKGENYRIGNNAFENNSFKSISIPNSVIGIENEAFRNCSNLTNIVIPNSVTNIGSSAFYGCSGLKNIIIPNSVTSIGSSAFYGCSGLTNIIIPNSVTSIGSKVFERCKNLYTIINFSELEVEYNSYTKIILNGNKNKQVEDFFFSTDENGIHHLSAYIGVKENIELPKDYKGESYKINNYVFYNHTELTSIVIPNSVTKIGGSAFSGCSKLASISIPSSVTSIEGFAFEGCAGIRYLRIEDSPRTLILGDMDYYRKAFHDCTLDSVYCGRNIDFGDGLAVPFGSKGELKSFTIGELVTCVDFWFGGCSNLITVTVKAKRPPTVNWTLSLDGDLYNTIKLRIPQGTLAAYQTATGWKNFFNIEEFDPATSIANITPDAEEKNLPIYNLQGTRMTEEKENLPTGIYIQGGKKIFIK